MTLVTTVEKLSFESYLSIHDHSASLREFTDPRTIVALAHPTRLTLLELLRHAGPMTATEAGEQIGESPSSCSFHLRQLAKYGFVEEAPKGRRPPKAVRSQVGMSFTDVHDDPETTQAAIGLERVLRDRNLRRRDRLDARLGQPPQWRRVLGMSDYTLYVTPDELHAVEREIPRHGAALSGPDRGPRPAPKGSQPIQLLWMAYPYRPGERVD